MGRYFLPLIAAIGWVWPEAQAADKLDTSEAPRAACVQAKQSAHDSRDDTLIIELTNNCSAPVGCQVQWQVLCGTERARSFVRQARIDSGQSQAFEITASMCRTPEWRITAPTWECKTDR